MSVRKIAIHHSFPGKAEAETAARVVIGAERLGLSARAVLTGEEISEFDPDLVLCVSHHEGKITRYPTYGVIMAPRAWMETPAAIANILSYDGYLTLSGPLRDWLGQLAAAAGRAPPLVADYTNTPYATPWMPGPWMPGPWVSGKHPTALAYIGTNWDGHRHIELFTRLARRQVVRFYGPAESWRHVDQRAYCGTVPFDGEAVMSVYRSAGAGLGIDRPDFAGDDLANRAFEIIASGVPALVNDLPFLRRAFGEDTLHFLDSTASARVIDWQIGQFAAAIAARPDEAQERAHAAHTIFNRDFALERLLPNLLALHQRALAEPPAPQNPSALPESMAAFCTAPPTAMRRLNILDDLTETGTFTSRLPEHASANLEAHFDAEPSGSVTLCGPSGSRRNVPLGPATRIGNVWRITLPVDAPALAAARSVEFSPRQRAGLVGLSLRAGFDAPTEQLAAAASTGRVWIFGAAEGGRRVAQALATIANARCAGFIDDFQRGPLAGHAIYPLAEAAKAMHPRDCVILASRHWPIMWRQLAGLGLRRVYTAEPGYGHELTVLPDC